MEKDNRPDWDEYFMDFADLARKRTTCLRRGVGAVIVSNNRIIATGYNGVPSEISHCSETGCLRDKLNVPSGEKHELCRGLHAEQNAIISAANYGIATEGSTIYVTTQPCIICSKMIINAGIKRVVYAEGYPDEMSMGMLREAEIIIEKYSKKEPI